MRLAAVAALLSVLASGATLAPPASDTEVRHLSNADRRSREDKQHGSSRHEAA